GEGDGSPGTERGTRTGSTMRVGGPSCPRAVPAARRPAVGAQGRWTAGPSGAVPLAVLFEDRVRPLGCFLQSRARILGQQHCLVQSRVQLGHSVADAWDRRWEAQVLRLLSNRSLGLHGRELL